MAAKNKSTFASASAALSKALRNMEAAISSMVGTPSKSKKKKAAKKKKSKKSRSRT